MRSSSAIQSFPAGAGEAAGSESAVSMGPAVPSSEIDGASASMRSARSASEAVSSLTLAGAANDPLGGAGRFFRREPPGLKVYPLPSKKDFGAHYRLADGADLAARLEEIEKRLAIAEVPTPEPTIVVRSSGDERRREIYDIIVRAAELDLIAPTYVELADRLDTAPNHVNRYVNDLVDTGLLRRHGNQGQRYYEVIATKKFTRCPPNRGLQAASRNRRRASETTNRKEAS